MHNITTHTQKIDGYEIIIGFGQASVDPVATQAAVMPEIEALAEMPEINKKKAEIRTKNARLGDLRREAIILWTDPVTRKRKPSLTPEERLIEQKIEHEWNGIEIEVKDIEKELTDLWGVVAAKRKELIRVNPVFFEPNAGEYRFDETKTGELMQAWMAKSDTEQVTVDGETVPDYRGKTFWTKDGDQWLSIMYNAIGIEPQTGSQIADLTDDQRQEIEVQQEAERVAGLTDEARQDEYDAGVDAAATAAAEMEAKLKIQDVADATEQAKISYQIDVDILKQKYGVE